jgi:archaellum component FlaC
MKPPIEERGYSPKDTFYGRSFNDVKRAIELYEDLIDYGLYEQIAKQIEHKKIQKRIQDIKAQLDNRPSQLENMINNHNKSTESLKNELSRLINTLE